MNIMCRKSAIIAVVVVVIVTLSYFGQYATIGGRTFVFNILCNASNTFNASSNLTTTFKSARKSGYVSMCSLNYDRRRLGNQLFNFAAMLQVATMTNREIIMPVSPLYGWIDKWFDVNVTRVHDVQKEVCPCAEVTETKGIAYEKSFPLVANNTRLMNVTTLLVCGWFQSWKYIVGIEDELRRHLRWKQEILTRLKRFLDDTKPVSWSGSFTRVGVHIRCGDILEKYMNSFGFTVPNITYLQKAVDLIMANTSGNIQFLVTTDNMTWTKEHMNIEKQIINSTRVRVTYSEGPGHDAGFDMALLSSCDKIIMTTGSYGWWSAWLANKPTIYYKNWPRVGSTLIERFVAEDYFPPNWIPIEAEEWKV